MFVVIYSDIFMNYDVTVLRTRSAH